MPVAIRETTVTPADGDQSLIQLHISDVPSNDESATFDLQILVKMRAMRTSTLAHLQCQAMKAAQDALTPILQQLEKEIRKTENRYSSP